MLSRIIAAAAACMLLASCFLVPGEFESYLAINTDGSYRFSYKGQIQLALLENGELRPPSKPEFRPEDQYCEARINNETGETEPYPLRRDTELPRFYEDEETLYAAETAAESAAEAAEQAIEDAAAASENDTRPVPEYRNVGAECTEEQLAYKKEQQDLAYQSRLGAYQERIAALNAVFGGAIPGDDASMEKLATKLESYAGWDSVEYKGNDIFQVSYSAEGIAANGFVFPVMADAGINLPFVQILPRKDGSFEVIAPGFGGKGNFDALTSFDNPRRRREGKEISVQTKGTFTLTTDGEVLSNNSQKGLRKEYGRRIIEWDVLEGLASPRALIGVAGD